MPRVQINQKQSLPLRKSPSGRWLNHSLWPRGGDACWSEGSAEEGRSSQGREMGRIGPACRKEDPEAGTGLGAPVAGAG